MAVPRAFINNAIAQLFDEIEDKCHVKFSTFTASDAQGQENKVAEPREYMENEENNESHGIYKYLYDPNLNFDFRFHQRLAAAPFKKTSKPWVTIMFNTKQPRTLTNILSHLYTYIHYEEGVPYEIKLRRMSVPVNMVLVSNDIDKLYETVEKMGLYFDRFINFHYDHVFTIGKLKEGGFDVFNSVVGQAANIREVDLTKLDTEHRGSLVSQAYQFDLVYWVVKSPDASLHTLKRIILQLDIDGYRQNIIVFDETEGNGYDVKETEESPTAELPMYVEAKAGMGSDNERMTVVREDDVVVEWWSPKGNVKQN